jgi:hypothetical protein
MTGRSGGSLIDPADYTEVLVRVKAPFAINNHRKTITNHDQEHRTIYRPVCPT